MDFNINVLLIPLLGGYIYIKKSRKFRYYSLRYNTQEILLSSAVAGFIALVPCYFLGEFVNHFEPCWIDFLHNNLSHIGYIGTSISTFLLLMLVLLYDYLCIKDENTIANIIDRDKNAIEVVLKKALTSRKTVSITLKNRKVYIGNVIDLPSIIIDSKRSTLLLPTFSGYRLPKELDVVLTTMYSSVIFYLDKENQLGAREDDSSNELEDNNSINPQNYYLGLSLHDIISVNIIDYENLDHDKIKNFV